MTKAHNLAVLYLRGCGRGAALVGMIVCMVVSLYCILYPLQKVCHSIKLQNTQLQHTDIPGFGIEMSELE